MSIPNIHIVIKQQVLSTVETPLKSTRRIRYTCFEVSQNFLIFGATSGGIYIFKRDPCSFCQLVPSKDGSITKVCMSKDERFIAFATTRGVACIFEWNEEDGFKMVNRSIEHENSVITELVWGEASNHLYIGDHAGRLSVINVSLFMNKSIFMLPAFIFMQLNSGIVQISCFENYLLVSTVTWSYICDTSREHYRQIGSRPREGPYGACFLKSPKGADIFCARPGSRIWQVDLNGVVLSTHQFKKALAVPPSRLILLDDERLEVPKKKNWSEQNLNFSYLSPFLDKFLFTYKEDGIYLFDPVNAKIVAWTNHFNDIVCAKCVNNAIYLWTSKNELHCLIVSPLDRCLLTLIFQGQFKLCCDLCEIYYDDIVKTEDLLTLSPLATLIDYPDCHMYENTSKLIDQISKQSEAKKLATRLDSGIFLVENRHWKKWKIKELRGAPKRKTSGRSSSVPPDICESSARMKLNRYFSLPNMHISVESELIIETPRVVPVSITKTFRLAVGEEPKKSVDCEESFNTRVDGVDTDPNLVIRHSVHQPDVKRKTMKFDCDLLISLIKEVQCDDSSYWEKCFLLFDAILDKYVEYNNNMPRKKSEFKKNFLFSKFMPVECTRVIQKAIHSAISSGLIVTYLDSISSSHLNTFDFPTHPSLLQELHQEQELKIDVLLKNILFIFSEAIDPFTILQCLENSPLSCIYLTWCEILDSFQESAFSSVTSTQDKKVIYTDWPLPIILNMLHQMFRMNQLDTSCQLSLEANVKLYHASFLSMKLVSHFTSTGLSLKESETKSDELFLRFISRFMDRAVIDEVNFNKYCVSQHTEKAFVSINCSRQLCRCGYPVPVTSVKPSLRFPKIGRLLACNYLLSFKSRNVQDWFRQNSSFKLQVPEDSIRILIDKLSDENGIEIKSEFVVTKLMSPQVSGDEQDAYSKLRRLVQIMPALMGSLIKESSGLVNDLASHAVHFNVFNQWTEIVLEAPDAFWLKLFNFTVQFSRGVCPFGYEMSHGDEVDVQWSGLTLTTLKICGADKAIEFFGKYAGSIDSRKLDDSVFRTILLGKMVESHFPGKLKSVLSSYSDHASSTDQVLIQDGLLDLDPSTIDLNTHTILQDNDNFKWTVQIDSSSDVCSRCSLSLDSEELAKEGVRVFKCAHFYHIICLNLAQSQFSCLLCSTSNLPQ